MVLFIFHSAVPANRSNSETYQVLKSYVTRVQAQIEKYRRELLGQITAQKKEVLGKIDGHYKQLHYANSIVTGHLASVAKVHDAQKEILEKFGFQDLRGNVGNELAEASIKLSKIVDKAERTDAAIKETQAKLEKLLGKEDAEETEAEPPDGGDGDAGDGND